MPTTSTGTTQDRCAPSTTTCTAGVTSGSTPVTPSAATVAAPITIPEPANVTGGTASGLAVIAQ